MSRLLTRSQAITIIILGAVATAVAVATLVAAFNSGPDQYQTAAAPARPDVKALTPWGIDWGIGAACYKVSAFDSTISCVKVSPDELELFKKTLEAQRSS